MTVIPLLMVTASVAVGTACPPHVAVLLQLPLTEAVLVAAATGLDAIARSIKTVRSTNTKKILSQDWFRILCLVNFFFFLSIIINSSFILNPDGRVAIILQEYYPALAHFQPVLSKTCPHITEAIKLSCVKYESSTLSLIQMVCKQMWGFARIYLQPPTGQALPDTLRTSPQTSKDKSFETLAFLSVRNSYPRPTLVTMYFGFLKSSASLCRSRVIFTLKR